jgi:hypothetical protein
MTSVDGGRASAPVRQYAKRVPSGETDGANANRITARRFGSASVRMNQSGARPLAGSRARNPEFERNTALGLVVAFGDEEAVAAVSVGDAFVALAVSLCSATGAGAHATSVSRTSATIRMRAGTLETAIKCRAS